jgi:hypothetical protein
MPMDLEQQILKVLRGMGANTRPPTFGDLARRFGVTADLVAHSARLMVEKGVAKPSMVEIHGVNKMHGLLPQPAAPAPAPPAPDVLPVENEPVVAEK